MLEARQEQIVAILHDILEDPSVHQEELALLPESYQKAVVNLARRDGEENVDYLARLATDPITYTVKMADLLVRPMRDYPQARTILRKFRFGFEKMSEELSKKKRLLDRW